MSVTSMPSIHITIHLFVVVALVIFSAMAAHAAPPKLDYFFPAGAQRGQTAEVTAAGSFDTWPVQVWTDHPGVEFIAGEKKGEFSVSVADDVDRGVCWVRLSNAEGATPLRPFIIGTLEETLEAEPNDAPGKPQALGGSTTINGKFDKRGDVDSYAIELQQGQTLVASLQANELLASPMDGVLQIADPRGFVLAQNNDARGLDPLIVFEAPADGKYLVRAFAFPSQPNSTIGFAGGGDFVYRLTVTTGPFLDHVMPLAARRGQTTEVKLVGWNLADADAVQPIAVAADASETTVAIAPQSVAGAFELPIVAHDEVVEQPNHSPQSPLSVAAPTVISGTLAEANETDAYRFRAAKGEKIVIEAESDALGFLLDPVLEVADAAGKVLTENDDAARDQRDARLVFTAPADGEYDIRIRDLHGDGGMRYAYRLTIAQETPSYALTVAAGEFAIERGKTLEIPVTVARTSFTEAIEITAIGLPEGVSVEVAKSEGKGDSSKEVKLKFTTVDAAVSGPFRVVGHPKATEETTSVARFIVAGGKTHDQMWITVK